MTTPAPTRRLAAFALVGGGTLCAAVVAPAVDALARPPHRPAAWFSPPEALSETPDAARAAPGDTFKQADSSTLPSNWLDSTPAPKAAPRVAPRSPQQLPPSDWDQFKKWVGGKGDAVKKAVTPEPPPQPPARVNSTVPQGWGLPPQPSAAKPGTPPQSNSTMPQAWAGGAPQQQQLLPPGPTTYAGNPAYRWYGWGTVTPGSNPYAPDGTYPQASGSWYSQTGATPGAFPVPAVNAFRPPPGPEPPVYVGMPQKVSLPRVAPPSSQPVRSYVPPPPAMPKPIAQTPTFLPPTGPTPPPVPQAWRPPTGILSESKPEPAVVEPKWQPASATVPVTRGQMPDDNSEVDARIRAACDGLVSDVTVRRDGTDITVSFTATTQTVADIAAGAVAAIPQLKPVAVKFDARLGQR